MFKKRKYQSNLTSYDKVFIAVAAFMVITITTATTGWWGVYFLHRMETQQEYYKNFQKQHNEIKEWAKKAKIVLNTLNENDFQSFILNNLCKDSGQDKRINKMINSYKCKGIGAEEAVILDKTP